MLQVYDPKLSYPHLSMLMESTVRGLDTVAARGFIDDKRVGIGGVSHGAFIPLYMMQMHDRIAAISIASPNWTAHEYYSPTQRLREWSGLTNRDWKPKPEGAGAEFWRSIDIADHVDEIEGPILMNLPAAESAGAIRLIRHLYDAGRPYDAYIFPNELHIKWQPAHLDNIMNRNLDWFHFWLQDYEDPTPAKKEQYVRWRELRKLQRKNPRSLRDYRGMAQ